MNKTKLLALTTLVGLSSVAGCMVFMNTEPNKNRVSANVENPYSVTYTHESFVVTSTDDSTDLKKTVLTGTKKTLGGSDLVLEFEILSNSSNIGRLLNNTIYQSYGSGHLLKFTNLVLNNIMSPTSVELKGTLMKNDEELNTYVYDSSSFVDNGDGSWSIKDYYENFGSGFIILQSITVNYTCGY